MDAQTGLETMLVVAIVSALSPFIAAVFGRLRLPQVVVLIIGGVVVGPEVLGWADPASVGLLADVGLGFLFLMAGYELELGLFAEPVGRRAVLAWFVTAGIAVAVIGLLASVGFVNAFVPVALGLTTTAFGTLLPILRDNDMLGGRFGSFIMPAGAVGEFLPIVGIAIFLSANGKFLGLLSLVAMLLVALLLTVLPRLTFLARFAAITSKGEHATSQTTLRLTVALLFALLVVASEFGLDVVLGAFLAGVVLRRWAPGDVHSLETKLDAVGYGFFIPVFFVTSGMNLDLASIADAPMRLVVFFVLLLAVRGLPAHVPLPPGPRPHPAAADDAADRDRPAAPRRPRGGRPEYRAHAPRERRGPGRGWSAVGDRLPGPGRRPQPTGTSRDPGLHAGGVDLRDPA